MTLTELRYITAVARLRHFGKAAKACFVSQPTLSIAVKKLEDELGVTLFERSVSHITITPQGEQIIHQAQRVLEEADQIKLIAAHGKGQLTSPLRVGAIYTIGPYIFPQLIPALLKQSPDMPLQIEENYTANLSEQLKSGNLDAIIVALPFQEAGIEVLALYDEPFVIVLPSDHPFSQRKVIAPDELSSETVLMLGAGHCFRDQVLKACPTCQSPDLSNNSSLLTVAGSSLETIRHMVASGLGITVLPCTATSANNQPGTLLVSRNFTPPAPSRHVALAWRSSFPRPKAIEALRLAILASQLDCTQPLK